VKELSDIRKFVMDGVLAAREVQDVGRSMDLQGSELVKLSAPTESTDPSWYPNHIVVAARRMASVYLRLYLFENQVRDLIAKVLSEARGPEWVTTLPDPILREANRRRTEDGVAKFHQPRGDALLNYVSLTDLGKIIDQNWAEFEDVLYTRAWVSAKFEDLRLTRNAVAHMGDVSDEDLQRLDIILRDWNRQVG
jgi:hypothetical protein